MSPAVRPWRRMRRETAGIRDAVRAAPRRTVATESVLAGLVLLCALAPLPLSAPAHPVTAVLLGVWTALLVPARRVYPALTVLGCVPVVVGDSVWAVVVVPCVVWSGVRRIAPVRRAWGVVGASGAGAVLASVAVQSLGGLPDFPYLAADAGVAALIILLPALSGLAPGRRRPPTGLLRERNAYLEQARFLTEEAARMEERARIAAEMHDLLGQRLGIISVHAGALQLAAERQAPPLASQAELLRTTAGTAMEELRGILGVLRHRSAEETGERGTREDLSALVAGARSTGADAGLHWNDATGSEPVSGNAGSRPPLSTEVLTWPRLLGDGCAAMLVLLPTVGGALVLLIAAVLH